MGKTLLRSDFEPLKCPKCHKVVVKLVSVTDDGKGTLMCRRCKKKIRSKNSNKNFRKIKE